MANSPQNHFEKHLDCIKDPRHHNTRHLLHDMLLIALCAIISGADSWTQVAEYGRSKIGLVRAIFATAKRHPLPRHLRAPICQDRAQRLPRLLYPLGERVFRIDQGKNCGHRWQNSSRLARQNQRQVCHTHGQCLGFANQTGAGPAQDR